MSDLISRQAAINLVFSMCCRWNTDDPNDLKNMLMTAFQDLPSAESQRYMVSMAESTDIDRLKGIIAKPLDITIIPLPSASPRWIPCSERLPESGVPVLISHVGFVTEDFLDIDELLGGAYFWNSGIDLNEELNNIAWMPLPEPWKGAEDGN